jgi:hypothetical protein
MVATATGRLRARRATCVPAGCASLVPALSDDLGDGGVYWVPGLGRGFAWVNVDYSATFGIAIDTADPGEPGVNHALEFDGNNDFVAVPDSAPLPLTSSFTIEAWVRIADDENSRTVILSNYGNGGLTFGQRDKGRLYVRTQDEEYRTGGKFLDVDEWTHVAIVFDASSDVSFFVNGTFVQKRHGDVPVDPSGLDLFIGRRASGGRHWIGAIDEIRIWNLERDPADIQADMHVTLNGDEPGLLSYWRFDEGTDDAAFDSAGQRHGQLVGGPWWIVAEGP